MPRLSLTGPDAPLHAGAPPANTQNEWMASLQTLVQQQQTPIWNTLSLQMAHNRQMQESILNLPQLLIQAQNKNAAATSVTAAAASATTSSTSNGAQAQASPHCEDHFEELSDEEEYASVSHNANTEKDFDDFSEHDEAAKPLTLVERLEKLYIRLPHLTPPPQPERHVGPSVRDNPEIAGRIRSLPAPPLILDTFQRFRNEYRKQDGVAPVLDEITGKVKTVEDDSDLSSKKKALTSAPKKGNLQFQVHNADHPLCAKLDTDYAKLFPEYSAKLFRLNFNQMNMLQMSSSFTLDACCHLDALLLGVKRCIETTQQKLGEYEYDSDEDFEYMMTDLQEALEYIQSLSFTEDFIVKKSVWTIASLTAFMRESMLATVHNLDSEIAARLRLMPFNSSRLYNK